MHRYTIVIILYCANFLSLSRGVDLLQTLPAGYDAGDATIVFLKDRLAILPEPFVHEDNGGFSCRVFLR